MANALCSGLLALMILPALHGGPLKSRLRAAVQTVDPEPGVSLAVAGALGIVCLRNRNMRG
jgi:hypothetical protein